MTSNQLTSIAVAALFACQVNSALGDAANHASADAMFFEAGRQARADKVQDAISTLERAALMAEGFFPDPQRFAALKSAPRFDRLAKRMEQRLVRIDHAKRWHTLQDENLLPEGITWSRIRTSTLVSSTTQSELFEIKDGVETRHRLPTEGRVLGMAFSPDDAVLCGASTNGFFTAHIRVNEIVCLSAQSLAHVKTIAVDGAIQLNDLVFVSPTEIYATDSGSGQLWKVNIDNGQVAPASAAGQYPAINGIAVSGAQLYLATRDGIIIRRWDDATEMALGFQKKTKRHSLGGVDGIYFHRGALIAIQNITNPGRVIRITLSRNGRVVTGVTILQSHHAAMIDIPTTGVVIGNRFRFLATTQLNRLTEDGKLDNAIAAKRAVIAKIPML
jgi:sugar lactone lactonase YvrE